MNLTCKRCGVSDSGVIDIDTGSHCHRELSHCIEALRREVKQLESALKWTHEKRIEAALESAEWKEATSALQHDNEQLRGEVKHLRLTLYILGKAEE